jgi:hypothetical protein
MEKILKKARMILRNVYVALGAAVMPVLIHAAYGMRQPDSYSYTVPVQGRIVSEGTDEPVAGIRIVIRSGYIYAGDNTDSDGRFLIYVPEENLYSIEFVDDDGFENDGFFSHKNIRITRDEIEKPLVVSLHRESQVAVIRGIVRSKGIIGKRLSGIRVYIRSMDGGIGESGHTTFMSGFEVLSGRNGKFSIQVPERDTYIIDFYDAKDLFQGKQISVSSNEIKRSLKVKLEKAVKTANR